MTKVWLAYFVMVARIGIGHDREPERIEHFYRLRMPSTHAVSLGLGLTVFGLQNDAARVCKQSEPDIMYLRALTDVG